MKATPGALKAKGNGDDRRQWRKQEGAVGAAACRMRDPLKGRSGRREPQPGGINSVNLTELFALLMFIIGLLTLIVEVVRLTFEVTTFFQKQERDNKKD